MNPSVVLELAQNLAVPQQGTQLCLTLGLAKALWHLLRLGVSQPWPSECLQKALTEME